MIIFWVTYERYRIRKQCYYTIDFALLSSTFIFALNFKNLSEKDFRLPSNKIYPLLYYSSGINDL